MGSLCGRTIPHHIKWIISTTRPTSIPTCYKNIHNSYHYLNMRGIENSILLSELTTLPSEDYKYINVKRL
jgi:hypothetical protein